MFLKIAGFELRYQMRNPVFWVAAVLFFLLTFGATTSEQIQIGSGGNVHKNSPYAIGQIYLIFSLFYMFVSTAFVANVIVRDDETGFGPIVRATRVTKASYLFGRYAGAFVAAAVGLISIPLAVWVGSHMPWMDPEQLGPNHPSYYFASYFWIALPDLFLTSALFFALATVTRSMMATYIGVIAFLILYTVVTVVLGRNPAYDVPSGYGEPLGFGAFSYATKYWTATERNTLLPPIDGMLLWNRAIWIAFGAAMLALAFALFRFGTRPSRAARKRDAAAVPVLAVEAPPSITGPLPAPRFDRQTAFAQLRARTRLELVQVFRSPAYIVLLALGLFNAMAALTDLGEIFGTPVMPVTRIVIQLMLGSFTIIPIIIAIYYGGELVWRERDRKTHEIIDASAVPDWAFAVPKTLAVALVLLSTLLISVIGGMIMQLVHGYTHFEIGKYLLWYVLPNAVDFTLLAILAVFLQALSPHKFVGWGLMVVYIISKVVFARLGLGDDLYNYGGGPNVPMSDMNGLGQFWIGDWWFRAYWAAFAIFLLVLTHALWRRGTETRLMPRFKRLPHRLNGSPGVIAAVALVCFAGIGVWCFTNTHVWNEYRTPLADERYQADYEKQLLPYEKVLQPAITTAHVKVDLWPHQRKLVTTGILDLVNRQTVPLAEVHVRMGTRDTHWTSVAVSGATLEKDYPRFQYRIYRFATPLAPGAVAHIAFTTVRHQIGFRNNGDDMRVVDNGTFVDNSEIVPMVGMDRNSLMQDRIKRRKYGLPPELRPAKLEDLSATKFDQLHADWINTDITVTTDADQTPIAPGYKLADTTANGRRTARFVTDAPIQNFYSIQSAHYLEKHLMHDGIDLAVYYDAQHPQNVDRMLAAFAHGLDYYQPNFGPYQFRQARIIEFPDYAQFAQAFAGTMPYSEGIGFIADLSDKTKIDYVTYVTAHELGHQWWAHQAVGADMQGATMLTESLAQYSALMVMEKLYGRDQIRRFLQYELDRYLRSRGGEVIEELPLDRVENQQYIHYRKGSLVMYRLKDELGADRVNAALQRYLDRFKFKPAPYPRSLDLIAEFRKGASPAENALITDLFDKITLYDIKTKTAAVRKLPDGRFETTLTVEAHKYYADGKGVETEAPMAERVDYGAFAAMPGRGLFATKDVLDLQRMPIHSGVQQIKLVTGAKPSFAGADPYNILIDRNSSDNVIATAG
jgi:ABC-2 type transport system permease protein